LHFKLINPFFGANIYPEFALKNFIVDFFFFKISKKFLVPLKWEFKVSCLDLILFVIELWPAK